MAGHEQHLIQPGVSYAALFQRGCSAVGGSTRCMSGGRGCHHVASGVRQENYPKGETSQIAGGARIIMPAGKESKGKLDS
mmetsp:Transcript_67913/g.196624  ORF Transcript_67913/g.196624 Transcript_67913/m.196624 type:complete len:80 (-) Transcript_67913:637-876(-)